ncbi:major facilitator superfamily domain-containing protein [Hysterangium stoloniferum]|nr:major facilitator superfamily domain-containing protein [Hysterangium stoloniferum]
MPIEGHSEVSEDNMQRGAPHLDRSTTTTVEKQLTPPDPEPILDKPIPSQEYPDGGLVAWLVVFSCFILNFNLLGITYAYGKSTSHYLLHQFPNDSPELIAFIGSSCTALTLTIGIPIGRWIDIYGFRKVVFVGSVILSTGLITAGFCHTVPTLVVTQGIVTGIGSGILFVPGSTAPAQWFLKRRSLSIGIPSAGSGLGGIFWSFFIRAIITKLGYHWALWLSGCIAALTNAIALIFLKARPTVPNIPQVSFWSGINMFKDPKFVMLYCASGLSIFGYMIPYYYVPTYAQTQFNASPLVGSILSAILDLGLVVGRVALGFAADSKLGTVNSIVTAMVLAGICQFAFWLPASDSLPLLYIFAFLYGIFGGGYIGLLPAVLARIFDSNLLPSIVGAFFTSELPGQLAGGPIAGAIFSSGGWTPVIVYSGITIFCGSLFAVATRFQVDQRIFVTI